MGRQRRQWWVGGGGKGREEEGETPLQFQLKWAEDG